MIFLRCLSWKAAKQEANAQTFMLDNGWCEKHDDSGTFKTHMLCIPNNRILELRVEEVCVRATVHRPGIVVDVIVLVGVVCMGRQHCVTSHIWYSHKNTTQIARPNLRRTSLLTSRECVIGRCESAKWTLAYLIQYGNYMDNCFNLYWKLISLKHWNWDGILAQKIILQD